VSQHRLHQEQAKEKRGCIHDKRAGTGHFPVQLKGPGQDCRLRKNHEAFPNGQVTGCIHKRGQDKPEIGQRQGRADQAGSNDPWDGKAPVMEHKPDKGNKDRDLNRP